jgi:hypothetical protein
MGNGETGQLVLLAFFAMIPVLLKFAGLMLLRRSPDFSALRATDTAT